MPRTSVTRQPLLENFVKQEGTVVDDFDRATSEYITTGIGTLSIDDTNVLKGSNSLRFTTSSTSGLMAKHTVGLNFDEEDRKHNLIWLYCHSNPQDTIVSIRISLSADAILLKRFRATILPTKLVQGWNPIHIYESDWTAEDDMTWNDEIIRIAMSVYAVDGQTADVTIDSITSGERGTPICVLTYDDNLITGYENGYSLMEERGILGTWYCITNFVGSSRTEKGMDLSDFEDLYDDGNCIGNHTDNHPYLGEISDLETQKSRIGNAITALDGWGFTRSSKFFGYPYGSYNSTTFQALDECEIISARGNVQYNRLPMRSQYLIDESVLTGYTSKYLTGSHAFNTSTTLDGAKIIADYMATNECTSFIMLHEIASEGEEPTQQTGWYATLFEEWLDYALELGIKFMTHDEWWYKQELPRYQSKEILRQQVSRTQV